MAEQQPVATSKNLKNADHIVEMANEEFFEEKIELAVDLPKNLHNSTKRAFCAYAAIILKLDFRDDWSENFCLSVLALIIRHFQSLDDTIKCGQNTAKILEQNTIKMINYDEIVHFFKSNDEQQDAENCDIVLFVETIKLDPFVQNQGLLPILADLITVFLRTGCYDSRYRVLMKHMCALLAVSWDDVEKTESKVVHLLENSNEEPDNDSEKRKKHERRKKVKRYLMIGAGGAVGGILLGVTGGLAAPILASGVAMLGGAAVGAGAGLATATGAAVIGSVLGVAGAGVGGYKMQRRVGAMEEFSVETLSNGRALHLTLAVSGWIAEERDDSFRWAWRNMELSPEQYCLRYESKYLLELGKVFEYLMSFAVSYAIQQTLMETALAGIVSALAWPLSVVTACSIVDNPWNVGMRRALEVGDHLAQVLLSKRHGNRPVTLLGFSLGARVIHRCLTEFCKYGDKALGIIEDVILLGAPVTGEPEEWKKISQVVGGRIVNGYSRTDWMLKFLYRTMNVQFTIAGTAPINTGYSKVVNVNLTHIVQGHNDYQHKLTEILKVVGVKVRDQSLLTNDSSSFHDFKKILNKREQKSNDKLSSTTTDDDETRDDSPKT